MADITPIASLNGEISPTASLTGELAMPEKVWMQGPPGAAATVTVGTVTTGEPGTDAIVTNSGTESAAVLNFTIPKGENGEGVPDGGTVGQLLGKTESGTAWIDPPQSGVQPDWNQNDETQPDFVKNRPCYRDYLGSETVTNTVQIGSSVFVDKKGGAYTEFFVTDSAFTGFVLGETYTVTIDGVTADYVARNFSPMSEDVGPVIGTATTFDMENHTFDGWICVAIRSPDGKVACMAQTFDMSFIGKTISISQTRTETVNRYNTKLLPEYLLPDFLSKNVVASKTEVQSAQTAADNAQTAADAAQTTANAAQSAANTALERVVEPYTRNTQMAPLYKNGGFSAWRGVVQEILYNKTDGYFFANGFDTTALKKEDMPNDTFCVKVYVENKSAKAFLHCFSDGSNYWGVSGFAVITDGYLQTGEILYVSSNTISPYSAKGLFLTFGAPSSMLLKSSTNNSTKQFRITVDDTGTLKATEVT